MLPISKPFFAIKHQPVWNQNDECFALFYSPQQFYKYRDVTETLEFHLEFNNSYVYTSFSTAESEIIRTAPESAKLAYIISKALFAREDSNIETYTLKTGFLFCLSRHRSDVQSIEGDEYQSVANWLQEIVQHVIDSGLQIPLFFAPTNYITSSTGNSGVDNYRKA